MSEGVLSTKGQLTIPLRFRKRMNLGKGDRVDFQFQNGALVIKPKHAEPVQHHIPVKVDKETGFPYFDLSKGAKVEITPEWIAQQLAEFP